MGEVLVGEVEEAHEQVGAVMMEVAALVVDIATVKAQELRKERERERERTVGVERDEQRDKERREALEDTRGRVYALLRELQEVALDVDEVRRERMEDGEVREGLQNRVSALLKEKRAWEEAERALGLEIESERRKWEREQERAADAERAAEKREERLLADVQRQHGRLEASQEKLMAEKLLNDALGKDLALLTSERDKENQRAAEVKRHLVELTAKCEFMVQEEQRLEQALSDEHAHGHSYLIASRAELVLLAEGVTHVETVLREACSAFQTQAWRLADERLRERLVWQEELKAMVARDEAGKREVQHLAGALGSLDTQKQSLANSLALERSRRADLEREREHERAHMRQVVEALGQEVRLAMACGARLHDDETHAHADANGHAHEREKEWLMHQVAALRAEAADAQAMLDDCEELLLRRQVEAEEMKLEHLQGVIAKNTIHAQQLERLQTSLWGEIDALSVDKRRAQEEAAQGREHAAVLGRVRGELVGLVTFLSETGSLLKLAIGHLVNGLQTDSSQTLASLLQFKSDSLMEVTQLRQQLGQAQGNMHVAKVSLYEAQQEVFQNREKELQMQRLITETRAEVDELRRHIAQLVVLRAVEHENAQQLRAQTAAAQAELADVRPAVAELETLKMLALETSSRIARCDTLVENLHLDVTSAVQRGKDRQERVHVLCQKSAAAEALAHQRLQALEGSTAQRVQQVQVIAALQADKLALAYSVETKLECLIAVEAHNAHLKQRLEATERECQELGALLQENRQEQACRDADQSAASDERALANEGARCTCEETVAEKVAAREKEILTQLQHSKAVEDQARWQEEDMAVQGLAALTERLEADVQQASLQHHTLQQQHRQQLLQQQLVEERLHAAQEAFFNESETVSKQQTHLERLAVALQDIQKKLSAANLPVQLHAFVDRQCSIALKPLLLHSLHHPPTASTARPLAVSTFKTPGPARGQCAASNPHAQARASRACQLLHPRDAVRATPAAQVVLLSPEGSRWRLERGEGSVWGASEAARTKSPSTAVVRTPCTSWHDFVELRSHELSRSQSMRAHTLRRTRATPQDVLRQSSFATSPALPEAEEHMLNAEPSLVRRFESVCVDSNRSDSNPLARNVNFL